MASGKRPHRAVGHFRVFGIVNPGYVKVQYVDHIPPLNHEPGTVMIFDEFWVDEIPIGLVPFELRMPNTDLKVTVENRQRVIAVEPYDPPT
jgi:hypothetical protein